MKVKDIFKHIDDCRLALPDFQREFEWKFDKQRSLLASFITELPIGSLLTLVRDKPRFCRQKTRIPPRVG